MAFSSVAIWSALYSRVFLKTPISCVQWIGIAVVTLGLAISPLSSLSASDSPLTGILLTLVGAQFYALSYVLNEYIMVSCARRLFPRVFRETRGRRRSASESGSSTP